MTNNYYKNLTIWKSSIDLVERVYKLSKLFPADEKFGLTSQIRRASVSVPSNIAEGYCRQGQKETAHFISIAIGSLAEVETQIIIANKLGYLENQITEDLMSKINSIQKQSIALRKRIQNDLVNSKY
jgi:four helix bundle protein